jgi:hypothetical protein
LEAIRDGGELLQVYYPHLEDTVEVLQVKRVLERMNTFLRLMHEGLSIPKGDHRRVDVRRELIEGFQTAEVIRERLRTAFPVPDWALSGERTTLMTSEGAVKGLVDRFEKLRGCEFPGLSIEWEPSTSNGTLLGTVKLRSGRIQPFALLLRSEGERIVVRCVSPIGCVDPESNMLNVEESAQTGRIRLGAILGRDDALYDLTVEDDVILGDPSQDAQRMTVLFNCVVEQADILEQIHLPPFDRPMASFKADLQLEGDPNRA